MKNTVKILSLLLAAFMLLCVAGCNDKNVGDGNTHPETAPKAQFNRLASVRVTDDGEVTELAVVWEENLCRISGDGQVTVGSFDPQARTFNLKVGQTALPVCDFDQNGKIIMLYNEDKPTETWAVTYDEKGWPAIEGYDGWYTLQDAQNRVIKCGSGGGGEHDENGNSISYRNYDVRTFDKNGNIVSVDQLKVTTVNDGEPTQSTKKDIEKYTYDENGNLIKYQRGDLTVEYTYSDAKISHVWERMIPICYVNFFYLYDLPMFWYLQ